MMFAAEPLRAFLALRWSDDQAYSALDIDRNCGNFKKVIGATFDTDAFNIVRFCSKCVTPGNAVPPAKR